MQVLTVSLPTDRPLISEVTKVVRLTDYEVMQENVIKLERQMNTLRNQTNAKQRRYGRNPRFKAAYNYWYGQYMACEGLLFTIRQIINQPTTPI